MLMPDYLGTCPSSHFARTSESMYKNSLNYSGLAPMCINFLLFVPSLANSLLH